MNCRDSFAWTDERVATFRNLHAAGFSYSVIGSRLGISRSAVSGKADRLGLSRKSETQRQTAKKQRRSTRAPAKTPISESRHRPDHDTTIRSKKPGILRLPDAPLETPSKPTSAGKHLIDLASNDCRFSIGMRDGKHAFCGAERLPGKPYCAAHSAICYRKGAGA